MIIAFTGGMGAGKTTAAKFLKLSNDRAIILKFAEPLYDMQKYIYNRANLPQPLEKDRKLLQLLGTDWGREQSPDLWVDLWEADANTFIADNWSIFSDDCRFTNEAMKVREKDGYVVKIESEWGLSRNGAHLLGIQGHASEVGVDPQYVDYTVTNNGTILEFENKLSDVYNDIITKSLNLERNK